MNSPGPSEWLWKEGGGYYQDSEAGLIANPYLPNLNVVRDQRMMKALRDEGGARAGSAVLEIGCGRSPWLAYLAREGCRVSGIEIESHAARLARANLIGAKTSGDVYCRDAFDVQQNESLCGKFDTVFSLGVIEHLDAVSEKLRVMGNYLKPGGRIVSMVPNLQGINWFMQRLGSLPVLQAHVVYTTETLREVHEEAGFQTLITKYLGFFDGWLTSSAGERSSLKGQTHHALCRMMGLSAAAWARAGLPTTEWRWTAPLVTYVGVWPGSSRTHKSREGYGNVVRKAETTVSTVS
jgi:2-polyprenyl-3-methyl-5-hydroxy-6-metoxy-1,4-benzoquinol methylase